MGVLDALWHIVGFLMPAAFVAVVLAASSRFFKQNKPIAGKLIARSAIFL
ncbi:MAG: hypothetical protein HC858_05090 [Brachymonas sp.]|nr:hypothetical protein [Brachymonas sp.]NJS37316.1 hypothetical protein [Brachymonas sp.]